MLEPADLKQIDQLESSVHQLLDEAVQEFSQLAQSEQQLILKILRLLAPGLERLLADVGERDSQVPQTSIRALIACGCINACMSVVQADDEISLPEREVMLHLTDRLSGPLSLNDMTPVSGETISGSIESYTHLVDTYDGLDYRAAGALCAAIDSYRHTDLMAKFEAYVTMLGSRISFVDGSQADQREQSVLQQFEQMMEKLNDLIENAKL